MPLFSDESSARAPVWTGGAEMPWVDDVARQYGLEYEARQRAGGVAREMAAAGYTTAQARAGPAARAQS